MRKHIRTVRNLTLGQEYHLFWVNHEYNRTTIVGHCRFIKVTAKGFNFLNLRTNKCILKTHLYPWYKHDSYSEESSTNKYWVNQNLYIEPISSESMQSGSTIVKTTIGDLFSKRRWAYMTIGQFVDRELTAKERKSAFDNYEDHKNYAVEINRLRKTVSIPALVYVGVVENDDNKEYLKLIINLFK